MLGPGEPLLSTATCSRDSIEIKAKVTDPNHTESSGRARTLCWVCGAWRTFWWRCPGGLNFGERMGLRRALLVIREVRGVAGLREAGVQQSLEDQPLGKIPGQSLGK